MAATEPSTTEATKFVSLYFGYASNLSPKTLSQRCPDSMFAGIARLDDYKIFINETRFANIKKSPGDVVYGSLAFLSERDERALDVSEGVPWYYQKQTLDMTRICEDGTEKKVKALAYIDLKGIEEGVTEPDYVPWLLKAIDHGLKCGVPAEFFDKYWKPFIPQSNADAREINFVRMIGKGY